MQKSPGYNKRMTGTESCDTVPEGLSDARNALGTCRIYLRRAVSDCNKFEVKYIIPIF